MPFELEQVTSDTFNGFRERSIPTLGIFTADREVGTSFYNGTEDKNLWSYGMFFDSISEALKERINDQNDSVRIFERVGQYGAQFGRNKPNRSFFLAPGEGCSGWGA